MQRTAQAEWKGSGKDGSGTLTTPSGVLNAQPYSFQLRFQDEDGRNGTNPEELIAAAHAGCFSMALSFQLANAGFTADAINTTAVLTLEPVDGAQTITKIGLQLSATTAMLAVLVVGVIYSYVCIHEFIAWGTDGSEDDASGVARPGGRPVQGPE